MKALNILVLVFITSSYSGCKSEMHESKNRGTSNSSQEIISFTGIIVDDNDNPIPGVTLIEENDNTTLTTEDGKFEMSIPKDSKIFLNSTGFDNFSLIANQSANVKINIEQKTITFCCTNHINNSHCANTMNKMQELSDSKGCVFK